MKCQQHKQIKIETFIPVTTYICDNCKKGVSDNGEVMYGGSFLSNWFHLQKTIGSTRLEELQKPSTWDFCSIKCLQDFVQDSKLN